MMKNPLTVATALLACVVLCCLTASMSRLATAMGEDPQPPRCILEGCKASYAGVACDGITVSFSNVAHGECYCPDDVCHVKKEGCAITAEITSVAVPGGTHVRDDQGQCRNGPNGEIEHTMAYAGDCGTSSAPYTVSFRNGSCLNPGEVTCSSGIWLMCSSCNNEHYPCQ